MSSSLFQSEGGTQTCRRLSHKQVMYRWEGVFFLSQTLPAWKHRNVSPPDMKGLHKGYGSDMQQRGVVWEEDELIHVI